jgi:hypothetical protein
MKCLSYQQPYAWLILQRAYEDNPHRPLKPIENRKWPLPQGFALPQRALVHASLEMYDVSLAEIRDMMIGTQWLRCKDELHAMYGYYAAHRGDSAALRKSRHFGKIIGEITYTGQVTESDDPWFFGPYGFTLTDPLLYDKPIPWLGHLKFFEVDADGMIAR